MPKDRKTPTVPEGERKAPTQAILKEHGMTVSDKNPALNVHEEDPYNAGPPLNRLRASFVTPNELFYVRCHGNIPAIDPDGYRLSVTGSVGQELRFSLDDLRRDFPRETVTATLQCAGNRRAGLMAVKDIPGETPWTEDAISTATWAGVPLRAVLDAAGSGPEGRCVAFTGLDTGRKEGRTFQVGSSIPIDKAMGPEVLLAYEMNGAPLPRAHGAPLRVVVPGYIGTCNVKWLREIRLQADPSAAYTQAHQYKLFPPQVRKEEANWDEGLMLQELSINSAICAPANGATVPTGRVRIEGYAMAGGDRDVARVDVSTDGGATWTTATLSPEGSAWTWRFWEGRFDLPVGQHQIVARAVDTAANTQPEDPAAIWNFGGYMNNSWPRVTITVQAR
jgi:sulfite oxidase